MRVLYVEDEQFLAEAVKHNLNKEDIECDLAFNGEDGLNMALDKIYDVVILDVMLPKLSGIDILRRMRERKIATPVIMLSALSEVEDKVHGLESGADDYLAKPFKTAELVARIKALMRRPAEIQDEKVKYLNLVYDVNEKSLNGITLTAKEAGIIHELLKTPGKIVKKDFLLNKVWGGEALGEDNYIEVYISRLRKVLRKIGSRAEINSVRGFGYKIVEA
ncbi:MAG: response regulator transcription factor [Candidatus Saccharibacteria bacterium]|jgi:DNA-binding response OmpR family regulator|nr:response regulator transcription factor [Candidatus Saccharibacteria bacterium]